MSKPSSTQARAAAIEAEIAASRIRMDATLSELEHRLDPGRLAPSQLVESVLAHAPQKLTDTIRRHPLVAALLTAAAAALVVGATPGTTGAAKRSRNRAAAVGSTLVELVGLARLATKALRHAGVNLAPEAGLGDLLRRMAEERGRTAALLQDELQKVYGNGVVRGEPVDGRDRNLWQRVEQAVATGRKELIMTALEAAEAHTVARFRSLLKSPMPEHVRVVVGNRFQEAQRSYDNVKALRQAVS